jgi:hypothetical protein
VNVNFHVAATPSTFGAVLHATTSALTVGGASHLVALQAAGLTQASAVELTAEPVLLQRTATTPPTAPSAPPAATSAPVYITATTSNRNLLALLVLLVLVPVCFALGLNAGRHRGRTPIVDEQEEAALQNSSSKLAAADVAPHQAAV